MFGRPFAEATPRWDDLSQRGVDMWATEHETREEIVARYRRVCAQADETIEVLKVDAAGHVPWWPRPDVMLFNVLVHMLTETSRHAGHADILREQLDGTTATAGQRDAEFWVKRRAEIERAAKAAEEMERPSPSS